jgi:hypothetical protein
VSVQVVTVFAPREPRAMEYLPLLRLLRDTARRFGHSFVVVTDAKLGPEFEQMRTALPASLMPAMIAGVVHRLRVGDYDKQPDFVFCDADCLIARSLDEAFTGDFDLGLTRRADRACPINNGAMYVDRRGYTRAARFFDSALATCKQHWGADQEAISAAANPVPDEDDVIGERFGCRVKFLSMLRYAIVPKSKLKEHRRSAPFVVHFKGKEPKAWMEDYARTFLLNTESTS